VGERARSHRRLSQPIALERSPFREEDEGEGRRGGEGKKRYLPPPAKNNFLCLALRFPPRFPLIDPPRILFIDRSPPARNSPPPRPPRDSPPGVQRLTTVRCVASRFTFGQRSGISVEADRERAARLSEISNEVDISWEIYCPALMADPINGNLPRFPGTPSPPLTATVR